MTTLDIRHHYTPRTPVVAIVRDLSAKGFALNPDPRRRFIARRERNNTPPRAA